jgi:hypothetical protein
LHGTRVPHVTSNLFLVTATRQVTHAHGSPAKLHHKLCKVPVCARSPLTLWYLQNVHHVLCGNALKPIKIYFSAHALQPKAPWIYGLRGFGSGCSQVFYE